MRPRRLYIRGGSSTVSEPELAAAISSATGLPEADAWKLTNCLKRIPAHVESAASNNEITDQLAEVLGRHGFDVSFSNSMPTVPAGRRWSAVLSTILAMLGGGLFGLVLFATVAAWFAGGADYVQAIWQGGTLGRSVVFYASATGLILGMSIALGLCAAKYGNDVDA